MVAMETSGCQAMSTCLMNIIILLISIVTRGKPLILVTCQRMGCLPGELPMPHQQLKGIKALSQISYLDEVSSRNGLL